MSSLAHRSAAAPASTSRAGRHERRTCLVRLRLHLTVVSQRCSSAPAASRGASSCALRCCSSSESTLTVATSALLRAQVAQDERQLLLRKLLRRRRTTGTASCAVWLQRSNQELPSVLDALPAAPAHVQRAAGQFCKSRVGIRTVRIMHATQDGCAEAPRRALPGTEARDTRCGQSPLLLSCHLPHHGVRYAAECCQYAAERASILAPERCCDDRSLSSAKEGSQTSTFSRR